MSQESRPDVTGILPGCHRISARIRREGWPDGAGILNIPPTAILDAKVRSTSTLISFTEVPIMTGKEMNGTTARNPV